MSAPALVLGVLGANSGRSLAMPKSSTLMCSCPGFCGSGTTNTLSGLRSRWMMLAAWAAARAAAIWRRHEGRLANRQSTNPPDPFGQALALQEFHHHVRHAVGQEAHVDDVDDVGVVDGVGGARLIEKALDVIGVGRALRLENLDGRLAPQERMLREIDRPHPTLTQQLSHLVVVDFLPDHNVGP
jgi:hypothetical protein